MKRTTASSASCISSISVPRILWMLCLIPNCAKVSKSDNEIYEFESEFDFNLESDIVGNDESDTKEEDNNNNNKKCKLTIGKVHPWSTRLKCNPLKHTWKLICFLQASNVTGEGQ